MTGRLKMKNNYTTVFLTFLLMTFSSTLVFSTAWAEESSTPKSFQQKAKEIRAEYFAKKKAIQNETIAKNKKLTDDAKLQTDNLKYQKTETINKINNQINEINRKTDASKEENRNAFIAEKDRLELEMNKKIDVTRREHRAELESRKQ